MKVSTTGRTTTVDVVVVGAGLAGLTAARTLVAEGRSVVLFEATDRVGGRTKNHALSGVHVDLGGTFVGPGQDHIIELGRELGCATYPTYDDGAQVIDLHGVRKEYTGLIPLSLPALLQLGRIRSRLEKLASTVPSAEPWLAPRAAKFDALSFADWLGTMGAGAAVKDLLTIVARTTWGCELHEVSFLHVLHYVRESGGLEQMLATKGGAQEEHFVDGAYEVSKRMADELGVVVRLGSPVRSVAWDDNSVTVSTDTETVYASRVVVATPPAARARIAFTPVLPGPWGQIADQWPQGVLSKAYAIYRRPFWRDGTARGLTLPLSGQAQSTSGPVFITFDASPAAAPGEETAGILLGFIGGDLAREWDVLPPEERRVRALASFAALYGPEALDAIDFVDQRWAAEEWIEGGPTAAPGPGAWTSVGVALATPIGPIHWAGTETAETNTGFMDGAVRTGKRAARAVSRELAPVALTTATTSANA